MGCNGKQSPQANLSSVVRAGVRQAYMLSSKLSYLCMLSRGISASSISNLLNSLSAVLYNRFFTVFSLFTLSFRYLMKGLKEIAESASSLCALFPETSNMIFFISDIVLPMDEDTDFRC